MFYNIAKNQQVNPFENLIGIALGSGEHTTQGFRDFKNYVHKNFTPKTEAIGEKWHMIFPMKSLNFTTRISWYDNSTTRGKFTFANDCVYFRIDEENKILFIG